MRAGKIAQRSRATGIVLLLLLVVLLLNGAFHLGLIPFPLTTTGVVVCNTSPANPIVFDSCGGVTFSFKSTMMSNPPGGPLNSYTCSATPQAPGYQSNGQPTNNECFYSTPWSPGQNNGFTKLTDTSLTTTVGAYFNQFQASDVFGPTSGQQTTFNVVLPTGLPHSVPGVPNSGCEIAPYPSTLCQPPKPDPYTMTASLTGSGFVPVNSTNPEWAGLPTFANGTAINPYPIPLFFSSTNVFTNATGTYRQVTNTTRTLWQTRFLFGLQLTVPGTGAGIIQIDCADTMTIAGGSADCGANVRPTSAIATGFQGVLTTLNAAALLTNSQITVQVNIPAYWIRSTSDWYGGFGAWAGLGQGTKKSGTCTTVTSSCTSGLADHAPHGIYTCPTLSNCGAFLTAQQYSNVGGMSSAQICAIVASPSFCGLTGVGSGNVCNAGLPCTFYIPVNIASFGTQFSVAQTCGADMNNPQVYTCLTSNGATMVVPIIFDVLGSSPPVNVVTVSPVLQPGGTVTGKVLDGGGLFAPFYYSGLGGVTVSDGPPCNAQGCSTIETTTGADGTFSLGGLQPGGHQIYFTRPGYFTQQVSQSVNSGGAAGTGTIVMVPLGGVGNICIIPPFNSGVPGAPSYGGFCPPTWAVAASLVVAVLGLLVLAGFSPAFASLGTIGSAIITRLPARRGRR